MPKTETHSRPAPALPDFLMTVEEVSKACAWSPAQTWRAVKAGVLPQPIRLGGKLTRWRASEVQAAIASMTSGPRMSPRGPSERGAKVA